MFGNKVMGILADDLRQIFGRAPLCKTRQNFLQLGVINQIGDPQFPGVAVDKRSNIHHQVGDYLHISLFRLNQDAPDSRILDLSSLFHGQLSPCGSNDLSRGGIYGVLCQNMTGDAVLEMQFLIEFIAPHLGKVISSGVKKHGHNQALRTVHRERFAGANLPVELEQSRFIAG